MKVITYLGFTLLSILIQFGVMDYIHEKIKYEENNDLNATSHKKTLDEMLKNLNEKPHALYYRTGRSDKYSKANTSSKPYSNSSIFETELSTISSSTIIDDFYDVNVTPTEDVFTTETFYSTTEFDNVTEITFFDKKNQSTLKESKPKKSSRNKNCECDLLYEICDINCCCDSDCTEKNIKLFKHCGDAIENEITLEMCYPYTDTKIIRDYNYFDSLFCIAKTNLPDKRDSNRKMYDITTINKSYKWHYHDHHQNTEFQRKPYSLGDTIWVLKEGSIWYIDIPTPTVNNYCSGRKPILFLKQESTKCHVNIKDLEMLQLLNTSQEASCISVTGKSVNSSALNCSTLHCSNWTIIMCNEDGDKCVDYNKTIHEPTCSESYCTNIAFRLDYIFNYFDSKINNATIKFYTRTISTSITYITQEINVQFLLTNESSDQIVQVSGNPGYLYGLPILSSESENNHSANFFNNTYKGKKYLTHPSNKDGLCVMTNNTKDYVQFGINKRFKCKYVYSKTIFLKNSTNECDDIESNIKDIFGLNNQKHVSPIGNPIDIKDNEWLVVKDNTIEKELTYGQFLAKNSRLRCYNLILGISYVFTYADVSEGVRREDRIIGVNITVSTRNVTFNVDEASVVLTIDTNFIDVTKPKAFEYAGGPHLNIHLAKDFFFPFPSNSFYMYELNVSLMITCILTYFQIK